jgi:hypothetical protein
MHQYTENVSEVPNSPIIERPAKVTISIEFVGISSDPLSWQSGAAMV